MNIQTKFDIGQKIYFLREDPGDVGSINVHTGLVDNINIQIFNSTGNPDIHISYSVNEIDTWGGVSTNNYSIQECNVFGKELQILNFFKKNIRTYLDAEYAEKKSKLNEIDDDLPF